MAEIYGTGQVSSVQAHIGGGSEPSSGSGSGCGTVVSADGRNSINARGDGSMKL